MKYTDCTERFFTPPNPKEPLKFKAMIRSSTRFAPDKRQRGWSIFALLLFIALLLPPAQTGNAQEPTPTQPPTETATLTAAETATETEPAVPQEEAGASIQPKEARQSGSTTRVLVTISPGARMFKAVERVKDYGDVIEVEELSKLGVFMMELPSANLEEHIERIRNTTGILAVEPDYPVQAADTFPNDPGFASQYGLTAIRAPQGWDLATGSSSVTIAIIDSGVDMGHGDLAVKLVAGYDFVNGDSIPQDDYGHGTHVAGIAAALTNNGAGIAGVSWGARIMPVKVLDSAGNGSYSNVAAAIVYAVDNGAQVVNLSLGGSAYSLALETAVLYAYGNNVLMVASTGNTASNFVLYPARFSQVVAVGASNMTNQPAGFSNYGPEVDLAAPGENIYSTLPGGYGILTGTSMSAPHVSGLASILLGYIAGADSARGIMEATALDIGPAGWDMYSGAGLIQMDAALAMVVPPTATPVFTATYTHTPPAFPIPAQGRESSNLPGFSPFILSSTPTWTPAPPPTLTPASPTQTVPTPEASASLTPTATPTAMPPRENKMERLKILLSPYCCGSAGMIFMGIWLFWREKRKKLYRTRKP